MPIAMAVRNVSCACVGPNVTSPLFPVAIFFFLQTHRFFDGNFVERIHRHFNIRGFSACTIRFDAHLDVKKSMAALYYGDENFREAYIRNEGQGRRLRIYGVMVNKKQLFLLFAMQPLMHFKTRLSLGNNAVIFELVIFGWL